MAVSQEITRKQILNALRKSSSPEKSRSPVKREGSGLSPTQSTAAGLTPSGVNEETGGNEDGQRNKTEEDSFLKKVLNLFSDTAIGFRSMSDNYPNGGDTTSAGLQREKKDSSEGLLARRTPEATPNPAIGTKGLSDSSPQLLGNTGGRSPASKGKAGSTQDAQQRAMARRKRSSSNPTLLQGSRMRTKSLVQTTRNLLTKMDGSESSRIQLLVNQLLTDSRAPAKIDLMQDRRKICHQWVLAVFAAPDHPLAVKLVQYVKSFRTGHASLAHLLLQNEHPSPTWKEKLTETAREAVLELQFFLCEDSSFSHSNIPLVTRPYHPFFTQLTCTIRSSSCSQSSRRWRSCERCAFRVWRRCCFGSCLCPLLSSTLCWGRKRTS